MCKNIDDAAKRETMHDDTDDANLIMDDAIANLAQELPAVFARQEVGKLLGGTIAPGTIANMGKNGPPYFYVGRNASFERKRFLVWFRTQMRNSRQGNDRA